MSIAEQLIFAIQALRHGPEFTAGRDDFPELPPLPGLSRIIEEIALPSNALLFGLAGDGLPVLLSLLNPRPGPVLIVGDAGTGKTNFLRTVAQAAVWMHDPQDLRFGVVTPTPESWQGWDALPHYEGLWSSYDGRLRDVFFDLAAWAQSNKQNQSTLLLIDDLSALAHLDAPLLENLHWILTQGPAHRLWPLVTINAQLAMDLKPWVSLFHTRIYGIIRDPIIAGTLTPMAGAGLDMLLPGAQFAMRERARWIHFFLPNMD
jgi:DNA translocase FtsK/SpoIIIE-like protein